MMSQIDDAVMHAVSLTSEHEPKQAWARLEKKQQLRLLLEIQTVSGVHLV